MALLRFRLYHNWQLILEVSIYLVWVLLVGRQKGIVSTLEALPSSYRLFLVTLVALLLSAQLLGQSYETFPFVEWAMYSRVPAAQPQYYDYTAVLQSGQEVPLNLTPQFPRVSRQLRMALENMARQIAHDQDGPTRQAVIARYESTLRAVGRKYNLSPANDPVQAIRAWLCTISLAAYRGKEAIERRLFWHVLMDPEDMRRGE